MPELTYITMPTPDSLTSVMEVVKSTETEWYERILDTYTVGQGSCDCKIFKIHGGCIHLKICNEDLYGPEITNVELERKIERIKIEFRPLNRLIMVVGNAKLKLEPVTRIDMLVQSGTRGMETWGFIDSHVVRFIFSSAEYFDADMKEINTRIKEIYEEK